MSIGIIQPMKDRSYEEMKKELDDFVSTLKAHGHPDSTIVSPILDLSMSTESKLKNVTSSDILNVVKMLLALMEVSYVFFIGDWKASKECVAVYNFATMYNIPIMGLKGEQ